MVGRVVTGAHYGIRDWLMQRVTAVLMVTYIIFVVCFVVLHSYFQENTWVGLDHDMWRWLFSGFWMRAISLLFWVSVFYHAWIGVRNIVMDYVKSARVRLVIYVLAVVLLLLYSVWVVQILWGHDGSGKTYL
jgi:succinate dehydrogenase / fumarate reductase, membrane anchor subunit